MKVIRVKKRNDIFLYLHCPYCGKDTIPGETHEEGQLTLYMRCPDGCFKYKYTKKEGDDAQPIPMPEVQEDMDG